MNLSRANQSFPRFSLFPDIIVNACAKGLSVNNKRDIIKLGKYDVRTIFFKQLSRIILVYDLVQ